MDEQISSMSCVDVIHGWSNLIHGWRNLIHGWHPRMRMTDDGHDGAIIWPFKKCLQRSLLNILWAPPYLRYSFDTCSSLSTNCQSIRSVFNIASGDNGIIFGSQCCTHLKLTIGRVRKLSSFQAFFTQNFYILREIINESCTGKYFSEKLFSKKWIWTFLPTFLIFSKKLF